MVNYLVWVTTGDADLAGTDSNVFIRLAGTNGASETLHLPAQDIFSFETSSTDKFVLELPELGALTQCCIAHDNAEGDSGWYVKHVRVQHGDSGDEWLFTFDRWLGVEESGELSACVNL